MADTIRMCEAGYRFSEGITGEELMTEFGCVFGSALAQLEAQLKAQLEGHGEEEHFEAMMGTLYLLRHANAVFNEIHRRAHFTDPPGSPVVGGGNPGPSKPIKKVAKQAFEGFAA